MNEFVAAVIFFPLFCLFMNLYDTNQKQKRAIIAKKNVIVEFRKVVNNQIKQLEWKLKSYTKND